MAGIVAVGFYVIDSQLKSFKPNIQPQDVFYLSKDVTPDTCDKLLDFVWKIRLILTPNHPRLAGIWDSEM